MSIIDCVDIFWLLATKYHPIRATCPDVWILENDIQEMKKIDMNRVSKLPNVGTTIFSVMSKMAQDYDAINLSQGFPDFEPDSQLLDRVEYHLRHGKNQYPPMIGVAVLREAIAMKLAQCYNLNVNAETEITVTSGATEGLFCAIQSIVHPGDEVILFEPAFDCYEPAIRLAGGKTIRIPMRQPNYDIDWDKFKQILTANTKLVIINSPHNPTAGVLTTSDLDQLAAAIESFNCYVLSDEVYEHIIFDEEPHATILKHDALKSRSIAVFSFGKTYHVTGWKIGYCIAPEGLTQELRKVHQFNVFTTNTPMQWALADFVIDHPKNYLSLGNFYQQKRTLFRSMLKQSRFKLLPCRGTYFQLVDYSEISDQSDSEFVNWLAQQKKVAAIPLSPFYQTSPNTNIIRFCFAKRNETLAKAAELLCSI